MNYLQEHSRMVRFYAIIYVRVTLQNDSDQTARKQTEGKVLKAIYEYSMQVHRGHANEFSDHLAVLMVSSFY